MTLLLLATKLLQDAHVAIGLHQLAPPTFALLGNRFALGGGVLLAGCVVLIMLLPMQQVKITGETFPITGMRISFALVAVWWAVFSIPVFRLVPEPPVETTGAHESVSTAFRRLGQTIRGLL